MFEIGEYFGEVDEFVSVEFWSVVWRCSGIFGIGLGIWGLIIDKGRVIGFVFLLFLL